MKMFILNAKTIYLLTYNLVIMGVPRERATSDSAHTINLTRLTTNDTEYRPAKNR